RSHRSALAFYEWKHRRPKRSRDEPPQHCRKRLAVPTVARREERGRHSRIPAVFPHVRIDRHALVSAYRRRAHCYLSKSVGSNKECSVDRTTQTDASAGDTHFFARLFAKSRPGQAPQFASRHHRRGKASPRSREKFRGTLQ